MRMSGLSFAVTSEKVSGEAAAQVANARRTAANSEFPAVSAVPGPKANVRAVRSHEHWALNSTPRERSGRAHRAVVIESRVSWSISPVGDSECRSWYVARAVGGLVVQLTGRVLLRLQVPEADQEVLHRRQLVTGLPTKEIRHLGDLLERFNFSKWHLKLLYVGPLLGPCARQRRLIRPSSDGASAPLRRHGVGLRRQGGGWRRGGTAESEPRVDWEAACGAVPARRDRRMRNRRSAGKLPAALVARP